MARASGTLVLLASAILSCSVDGPTAVVPTTFSAVFPAHGSAPGSAALPVELVDLANLVTGLDIGTGRGGAKAVTDVPGDRNAIRVEWTGGLCDERVSLEMREAATHFQLTIKSETSLGGMLGCPGAGVPRAVIIHLRIPIKPHGFKVVQTG